MCAYLGGLAGDVLLLDGLNDADGHRLAHVAHGEAAQGRVRREGLDTHGLGRHHLHVRGVAVLDELWCRLQLLARAPVDLLRDLGKLARNVRRVAVEHRRIPVANLARVVHDDNLPRQASSQADVSRTLPDTAARTYADTAL